MVEIHRRSESGGGSSGGSGNGQSSIWRNRHSNKKKKGITGNPMFKS